jgi:hypothetical protein
VPRWRETVGVVREEDRKPALLGGANKHPETVRVKAWI